MSSELPAPLDFIVNLVNIRRPVNSIALTTFPLHSVALALLPSFIKPHISNATSSTKQRPSVTNLAILDGLRGLACLFVVNQHYTSIFTEAIFRGYGSSENDHWILQLPILNLPWQGGSMAAIFFVISGFVLSVKPLRLMRQKKWDSLQLALASSAFRRWFRLYLPVLASTMMIALGAYVGLFDAARFVKSEMGILTGNEDVPEKRPFGAQIDDWWNCILMMARFGGNNGLDPHLWTIPLETMSSMNLFVTLAALSRIPFTIRIILLTLLILITVWWNWEGEFLFFAGGLLADLHLESGAGMDVPHSLQEATSITRPKKQRRVLYLLALFVGMYLACVPGSGGITTPGYIWLESIKPFSWQEDRPLWRYVGAIIIVSVVCFYEETHPLFTNRFTQYLGKISFALYLMHGPVIRSLGFAIVPYMYGIGGGRETAFGFCTGWTLTAFVTLPFIFWAADVFCRFVDIPSVAFTRWLELKLSTEP